MDKPKLYVCVQCRVVFYLTDAQVERGQNQPSPVTDSCQHDKIEEIKP